METRSNRKYRTANMVAAGYSLSLVGKYGGKSIFQSIKRAESHILVGDFVQNVCDEFCQGYVVARVRAAKEETACGPFMDVALTEQIQTLQDYHLFIDARVSKVYFRHFAGEAILCLNFLCF